MTEEELEARRAKKREYDRRHYLENREEKLAKVATYRAANAMKISARLRARMTEEKKAARRVKQRAYEASPEGKATRAAWKAANPDYHRQADRDRYMLKPEKRKAKSKAYY